MSTWELPATFLPGQNLRSYISMAMTKSYLDLANPSSEQIRLVSLEISTLALWSTYQIHYFVVLRISTIGLPLYPSHYMPRFVTDIHFSL